MNCDPKAGNLNNIPGVHCGIPSDLQGLNEIKSEIGLVLI